MKARQIVTIVLVLALFIGLSGITDAKSSKSSSSSSKSTSKSASMSTSKSASTASSNTAKQTGFGLGPLGSVSDKKSVDTKSTKKQKKFHGVDIESGFEGDAPWVVAAMAGAGWVVTYDWDNDPVYTNNTTGQVMTEDDLEAAVDSGLFNIPGQSDDDNDTVPYTPGFESVYALTGLLFVALLVIERN